METESSLNRSIDGAKRHYSSMFSLPSTKKALAAVSVLCALIGVSTYIVVPSQGLIGASLLATSFLIITFAADLLVSKTLLKNDPLLTLRRIFVLSLFSLGFWFLFILLGTGLSFPFGWLQWVRLCLLGYAVVITLRITVLNATSMQTAWKKGLSVLLQPTLCIIAFVVFWGDVSSTILMQGLLFVFASSIISFVAVMLFFRSIERFSTKFSSLASIPLFRAFIVDWAASVNGPLEKHLEDMGQETDIEVNLLKFDSTRPKAAIIVPLVHPGPFKNIGSSLLPSLLKQEFEKAYGSETFTALGILGHELDLASQAQNQKVITKVISSAKFDATEGLASKFVRVSEGAAIASCQIFGNTALLSFTLAPQTTEDLPQELGHIVREQAENYGFKDSIVINAHNSLTDIDDTEKHLDELKKAASKCLQKAATQQKMPFMVGADSVFPKEFTLKMGMGTGGITAIVTKVENQKTAYIAIDGNNMIPHLREKILFALSSAGFDESEVFTTDTHAVTGLVTGRDGYNSIGKAIDHEVLIRHILDVSKKAESKLETCKVGWLHLVVPQVMVIGEDRLKSITTLVDKAIGKAKQMLAPIFGVEGLLLVLLLFVLIR